MTRFMGMYSDKTSDDVHYTLSIVPFSGTHQHTEVAKTMHIYTANYRRDCLIVLWVVIHMNTRVLYA